MYCVAICNSHLCQLKPKWSHLVALIDDNCYGINTHMSTFTICFRPLPSVFGQDAKDDQSKGHNEDAKGVCKLCFHRQRVVRVTTASVTTGKEKIKLHFLRGSYSFIVQLQQNLHHAFINVVYVCVWFWLFFHWNKKDIVMPSVGYLSTYRVRSRFSLMPLMQEARLRINIAFPIQIRTGFRVLLWNHSGEHGSQTKDPLLTAWWNDKFFLF